ncbi:hypothetical protein Tco_0985083 [Tanacetum coccineum]
MFNRGVEMVSLYMRCSMEDSGRSRDAIVIHEMFNGRVDVVSLYMRCSMKESMWSRDAIIIHAKFNRGVNVRSRDGIVIYEIFNGGVEMVSLYMRYSTEESRWNRYCIVVHEMLNGRVKMISLYMRCSSEESRCLGKMILDVNFLWKEERVHLLVVSLGTSMTSRYSLRPSTSLSDSPGPYRNAECLNCKLLVGKIKVLEATLEMYMHPEQHTLN